MANSTALTISENNIDSYMAEVSRHPLLSRDEEMSLAYAFRDDGDVSAAHRMVVGNLRFVVKIAHEYRHYGLKKLDLIQEGNMGLMMAVKKFDPDRGYRLISYAVWWIRAQIQSFIQRSWSMVKVGMTGSRRKLFFKLRSERALLEKNALPGEKPTIKDWEDHLTTLFPEVRMKKFLEMRGADGGPWASLCALPALWVGLLYDSAAQSAAWDLVKHFTVEDMARMRDEVPRLGLATPLPQKGTLGGGTMLDLAGPILDVAMEGLRARARPGVTSADETEYLATLQETVAAGRTPAEVLLERYNGAWGQSVDPVFEELAY